MKYPDLTVYQELDIDGNIMNRIIEPVSQSEFSQFARIDSVDPLNPETISIEQYITAAREMLEDEFGVAIAEKEYIVTWGRFPYCTEILLPKPPLRSVVSLSYRDEAEADHVVDPALYLTKLGGDKNPGRIVLAPGASWPSDSLTSTGAVSARFRAGWTYKNIPKALKQAIILLAAEFYKNREAAIVGNRSAVEGRELPFSVSRLMRPWHNLAS